VHYSSTSEKRYQFKFAGYRAVLHKCYASAMKNPIGPFLERQQFLVLDGGLATELENRGADLDHFLWSARLLAEAPELIDAVHFDYLVAGADVIATASYQASFGGFERAGFDRRQAGRLSSQPRWSAGPTQSSASSLRRSSTSTKSIVFGTAIESRATSTVSGGAPVVLSIGARGEKRHRSPVMIRSVSSLF